MYETQLNRKAIADPNGFGRLQLLLYNLQVKKRYESLFFELPEGCVCIDCGANCGLFTDLVLQCGAAEIHTFEPNPALGRNLERKYRNTPEVRLLNAAVSHQNGEATFRLPANMDSNYLYNSEAGSITELKVDADGHAGQTSACTVPAIRLSDYLKNRVLDHVSEIQILKLDVEGAEFDVLEDLIQSGVCASIRYVLCETHERFFSDGAEKIQRLQRLIAQNELSNVFLDWE